MGPVVETQSGRIEGSEEQGVLSFRGIPYARPPVGGLRFRSPEPPEAWAGVRDATRFGPSCMQNPMLIPLPGMDVGPMDESCLTLNVYTPGTDARRRPVLVWIHGGGFVLGAGSQRIYEGAPLTARGDVVVVTLNYRLGPFGFLYLADLCPGLEGAAANVGLRDQVAALRWVRENIAAFGGDPDEVTVFGESAGGMSVGTLLGVREARGLFRRAIAQSGACHNFHTRESATQVAAAYLEEIGLSPREAERKLREMPADKLREHQQQTVLKLGRSLALLPFQPVVDGDFLPEPALSAVEAGRAARVELLTGSTRDEWKLFGWLDPSVRGIDEATLVERLRKQIPDVDAVELVRTYRSAAPEDTDATALYFEIETDRVFRIPAIRLAEAQQAHQRRTFMYEFAWKSPMMNGSFGACHAIDVPFVFGALDQPGAEHFVGTGPEVRLLGERTMDAWLAFARGGAPGHEGLPEWPAYERERRATMVLGRECGLTLRPRDAQRAAWEGVL